MLGLAVKQASIHCELCWKVLSNCCPRLCSVQPIQGGEHVHASGGGEWEGALDEGFPADSGPPSGSAWGVIRPNDERPGEAGRRRSGRARPHTLQRVIILRASLSTASQQHQQRWWIQSLSIRAGTWWQELCVWRHGGKWKKSPAESRETGIEHNR